MDVPEVRKVSRVRVRPGDCVVVHLAVKDVTPEQAEDVKHRVRDALGLPDTVRVLVAGKGVRLQVVTAERGETGTGGFGEAWWR